MRPKEAELLGRFEEEARISREEARRAFDEEARFEPEVRDLRDRLNQARSGADEVRRSAEASEERAREAIGEAEAAAERVEGHDFLKTILGKQAVTATLAADRIRGRLGCRVTSDLEIAERARTRADERLRAAEARMKDLRAREEEARKRAEELDRSAKTERAAANRAAEEASAAEERLLQASDKLGEMRTASRSAMSRAWLKAKVVEGWVQSYGTP